MLFPEVPSGHYIVAGRPLCGENLGPLLGAKPSLVRNENYHAERCPKCAAARGEEEK
jgi:hypothetical protein